MTFLLTNPMSRTAPLALVAFFCALSAFSQDTDPVQALEARRLEAEAAVHARENYFALEGEPSLELEQAFAQLAEAPLADPTFLAARRGKLAAEREACARERLETEVPELRVKVWAACDAEDEARALEERLLAALSAGLEMAPGFREEEILAATETSRSERAAARSVDRDDPEWSKTAERTLIASEAERQLLLYQRAALRRVTVPSDDTLSRLVVRDLETGEEAPTPALRDRLWRAQALLGSELNARVASFLGERAGVSPEEQRERADAARTEVAAAPTAELEKLLATVAEVRETEVERHTARLDAIGTLEEQWSQVEQTAAEVEDLSILDTTRSLRLRESAKTVEALTRTLGEEVEKLAATRRESRAERRQSVRDWQEKVPEDSPPGWSEALSELDAAFAEQRYNVTAELDALLSLMRRTLTLRRWLLPLVDDRWTRTGDKEKLVSELELAPIWIEWQWREEIRDVVSIRDSAFEFDTIGELLRIFFDVILFVFIWLYLRYATAGWLRRATDALRKRHLRRFGLAGAPRTLTAGELEPIGRYGADVLGALVLHHLLLPRNELLAFAALVWMGWALLKFVPPAVRLNLMLFGRLLDPLSGENPVVPEFEAASVKAARWFVWWWILSALLEFSAVPLLQADGLHRILSLLSWTVFGLLLMLALARWSPWIRQFISELADQSRVTEWLSRPTSSRIIRVLQSAGGVVFVVVRIGFWLLVDRGWLSRSGTSLVVSQLNLADAGTELLAHGDREKIREASVPTLERRKDLEKLQAAFDAWRKEGRRGMVAVIGDHGMGKSVFLDQARELWTASSDVEVRALSLTPRKRTRTFLEQFQWLTEPLEIEIPNKSTRDFIQNTIVDRLKAESPSVFLVDDLHYLLRRSVGGFEVLQFALNIVQSCADDHFWVLTLHRPAWSYVNAVSASAKLAFRERIELSRLEPEDLGSHLLAQTRAAGYEPRFEALLQSGRAQSDREMVEKKARSMYWRLLWRASLGNPRVALDYWLSSLGPPAGKGGPGESEDGQVPIPVYIFRDHADADMEKMTDDYLFLLTALVVHDGLKLEDLSKVLNVLVPRVRVTCRHLESLGILSRDDARYLLTPSWQPAVLRVLNQKGFARS